MLYETLNQSNLMLIFVLSGLIAGVIFDVANFVKFLFANKKVACVILDFIATSLCLVLVFGVNVYFNYGSIRLFPFSIFFGAFCLERFTLGKIIAKIYSVCYNLLTKLNKKIWRKIENAKTNKNH